jgi:hypothetical protein
VKFEQAPPLADKRMGDWRIARSKRIVAFGCVRRLGGNLSMIKIAASALLMATASAWAAPYPAGSAQQRTADAIARVQAVDPQIHSVLALDPTAMAQAQRLDASGRSGEITGEPPGASRSPTTSPIATPRWSHGCARPAR